jgi:hypothetical protein
MSRNTTELTRDALSAIYLNDRHEASRRLRWLAADLERGEPMPTIELIGPNETITDVSGPCERMRLAV